MNRNQLKGNVRKVACAVQAQGGKAPASTEHQVKGRGRETEGRVRYIFGYEGNLDGSVRC